MIGPPWNPAAAPAASASGKLRPVATYATGTPGANASSEAAAEVSYRFVPYWRSTRAVEARRCHAVASLGMDGDRPVRIP